RVLFVSVDPDRDDPQQLETYTNIFGPQFIGLTGTQKQLKDLTKTFRATYGYGKPDESGYYDVSHSMALYGFDAEGQARVLLKNDEAIENIAADMQQLLAL
ncbi:SCO family protein, partial [Saccharospirillum sp.]|uniref:SCO family protein n=1 Tax=Saccharospirillum sp. TaxID=2033801 RepID=UPI0034A027DC